MHGCSLLTSSVTPCGENGSQTRQDSSAVPFWFTFRVLSYASHKCCSFFRLQKILNQISEMWKYREEFFFAVVGKNRNVWSTLPCEKMIEDIKHLMWCFNKIHCTEFLVVKEISVAFTQNMSERFLTFGNGALEFFLVMLVKKLLVTNIWFWILLPETGKSMFVAFHWAEESVLRKIILYICSKMECSSWQLPHHLHCVLKWCLSKSIGELDFA
jgi:hypothetical protein